MTTTNGRTPRGTSDYETTATNTTSRSTTERLSNGVLVLIVLLVGAMAGAASFSHVHDWTIHNSPNGTGDWFGRANAVITELIPIAALTVIAHRRTSSGGTGGGTIGYPMFLLVVSVGLSLTAQLAVAEPTPFGWMVSALPALAFFALSKLVFSTTRPTNPGQAHPAPATVAPAPFISDSAPATLAPAHATTDYGHQPQPTPAIELTDSTEEPPAPAPRQPAPAAPVTAPATPRATRPAYSQPLLTNARIIADAHRDTHGEPITPGQLAVRLRVPTPTATDILTTLNTLPTAGNNTRPHNGSTVGATL